MADLRESAGAVRTELSFSYAPDEAIALQVGRLAGIAPVRRPQPKDGLMARPGTVELSLSGDGHLAVITLLERRVTMNKRALPVFLVASCLAASAAAQTAGSPLADRPTDVAKTDAPAPAAPAPLVVYFDMGSSAIRNEDKAVLDHASRAYNEGKPIVMILTGTADRTGRCGSKSCTF